MKKLWMVLFILSVLVASCSKPASTTPTTTSTVPPTTTTSITTSTTTTSTTSFTTTTSTPPPTTTTTTTTPPTTTMTTTTTTTTSVTTTTTTTTTSPPTTTTTTTTSTTSTGTMTYGQVAALGASDFAICANCHGANGEGGDGPAIIGPAAGIKLYGTVGGLYDFISSAMPYDAPGSLSPASYLRITAFLVVKNNLVSPDMIWDPNNINNVQLG